MSDSVRKERLSKRIGFRIRPSQLNALLKLGGHPSKRIRYAVYLYLKGKKEVNADDRGE